MPNQNPTIVSASLSDKELQDSINKMVVNFDKGLQTMLEHSNEYVGKIQASLQKIGNTNFGATGSNGGAVVKQTKEQNDFANAVKKSTEEIKRQGKEGEMSFDQIAAALDKARRTVSDFNTKRASGILPSSEDYKRYEQALARIVEYNDKLKQSALGKAFGNEQAFAFDAKRVVSDLTTVDDRLKQLGKYYAEQEKQAQKTSSSINKQLEDEVGRRNIVIEQMRAYYKEQERISKEAAKIQNKDFREQFRGALSLPVNDTLDAYRKIDRLRNLLEEMRAKKKDKIVDISEADFNRVSNAITSLRSKIDKMYEQRAKAREKESAAQKKMIDDQYKLSFARAMKIPTDQLDLAQAKLERLQALLRDMRERGILSNTQIASTEAEIRKLEQIIGQVNTAQQQTTQSAQHYTEEIRKQAAAIRATKEWQEKGRYWLDGTQLIDPSVYKGTRAERQAQGTLEEQLLRIQQQRTEESIRQAQSSRQYAENIRQAAQELRGLMTGKRGVDSIDVGGRAIYRDTADVTIEQQLTSLVSERGKEFNLQRAVTEAIADNEKRISEELQKEVENERKINSERQNRINTKSADFWNNAERENIVSILAQRNQIDRSRVKNWDEETSSIQTLSSALKQYQTAYQRLTAEQRSSTVGKQLIADMQVIERSAQKARAELSRPIDLESAMRLPQKTLDDIAYKMRQLASYKQGIDLTKPNAANEIKQVDEALTKLQKDADKWMSKSNEMIKRNTALGRSWNYMKNRLAFYFTVGASTQFIKNLVEVRSQYEMNERALGILIDSAERGTRIFNELSQMALVSPYTLIELSTAAKQLTAYDIAAKDVVDTTRRLADMASAVGIPIERLTYALGQIKAYGYLNARDARMFSNAGIPLVKQLAEHYTELEGKMVSTADVYDRIKKKAIDMTDVMQVINKMTDEGGKFFDFQAKMAGTLKVQLANLTLAWNNMLNDIGASEQGTISTGIGLLKELFLQWKNISNMVANLAIGFGIVKVAQLAYYGVVMGTNKAIALETVLGNRLSNNLRSLTSSMNAASMSSAALWVGFATFAAAAVVDILRGNEAMKEFNKTLRENAENTYNDLKKFSENYSSIRESLYKTENGKQTPVDINSEEAKKAWEVLREQIELSSHASDEYIGKLLSIENVSERLRQGFAMVESIQSVSAAIKEIGDSTIKLERDWSAWWNLGLLPDGTIGNLQDAYMWLSKIEEKYGSVMNARKVASTSRTDEGFKNVFQGEAKEFVENYETELEKFRKDIQVTKQSIIDFIEMKGWGGDTSKINEAFKTFTDNLILKNQLNPQQAYTLQLEIEEARSKAAKQAQYARIKDLERAYLVESNKQHKEELAKEYEKEAEIYNNWDDFNGRKKVEWERFTKWLKEQHISETTAMFRNMDAEDIRSLNFQEGNHADWVKRMVTQYAKEHKMSYDDAFGYLKSWVTSANQWSIFIPMTISTEDPKTVYKQLGEYDKAVDEADAQIARLTTRINELNAKKKKSKEETKQLTEAEKELTQAQKDKADAEAKGGHGKKEKKDERAANKAAKQAESELAKALKEELSTIDKVRSIYKDLTKEGMSHADAVERATRGWDETVNAINKVLTKNGLQKLDLSKFAGIENPRELVNMLQSQLNTLLKHGAKPAEIKELQTKVNTWKVDTDKYDLTMITKGLDNELGKLKDEYELAVELDADPELGNAFASMMGIDIESLPHTVKEYADKYAESLNKYLKGKNSTMQLTGDELRGMTRDDINALQSQVNTGTFNQEWFDAIKKAYDDIQGKRKKDIEDTEKWKNSLIEKYGNLQDKLTKIYKDSVQNQVDAVKTFGTEDQKSEIVRLQLRLEATDDPAELADINLQIAEIVKDVTDKNPIALKLVSASDNQTKADTSKAYWEDFKNNDELYAMTFEDMANNSTRAIQLIIDKLEGLKDKVKEDPVSMKALMKSLEDAENELNARDPFGGVVRSLRQMTIASQETKTAQEALWRAEVDVEQAQQEFDNAEDGTPEERAAAQQKLADAVKRHATAQVNLTKAENKGKKGTENIRKSLQGMANQLQDVSGLFGSVSQIFKMAGDEDTSEAIDAINEGFTTMVTIIMAVDAAIKIMSTTNPYLLAIAAALSVIVGLVSFLSGNSNKKITEQVEESERAVKRLENAYKQLEYAAGNAFGAATSGAQEAMKANKELQLVELKRQLALEQSRDSKDKDEDKIIEIRGQIIDLEHEINDFSKNAVNDLLGISSHGDFFEDMISEMIEAFKNGEDAMEVFEEKWSGMIDNMIMKTIVSQVLSQWVKTLEHGANDILEKYTEDASKKMADLTNEIAEARTMDAGDFGEWLYGKDKDTYAQLVKQVTGKEMEDLADEWDVSSGGYRWFNKAWDKGLSQKIMEAYLAMLDNNMSGLQDELDKASLDATGELIDYYGEAGKEFKENYLGQILDKIQENWDFGQDSEKQLGQLQQGIQGITEDTAGALEAYMNGVSQQVYLQSDLLAQIRDAVVGMNMDVQVATQAQMLLQLQQSYAVQMAIQGILEGVLNPSGRAFSVELIS